MSVARVCYCTREMVMSALDIKFTARASAAVDRAIESAAENIEGHLNRKFFPTYGTRKFDWPNFQRAYPWKLYLEEDEMADTVQTVPVVTSGGNVIPANQIFWGPWNNSPPFTFLELDRSSSATFGQGTTPQRDILITGAFGYWIQVNPAGILAAAMSDTTGTVATVSDGALVGVGDMLIVDSERMLVQDKRPVTTGMTQQGSGVGTAQKSDVSLLVTDGTKFDYNEIIILDSERMFIVDITGNLLTVKRAWDGSVLATHTGSTIYALRQLTVKRGAFGTTAATHLINAACSVNRPPSIVRDLSIAEATVQGDMELGSYAGTQGEGESSRSSLGEGLAEKWEEATTAYGRQVRIASI